MRDQSKQLLGHFCHPLGWGSAEQELASGTNPDVFNSTVFPSHTSSSLLALPVWIWGWGCISTASLTHPHIVLWEQEVRKLTVKWRISFVSLFFFLKKMKRLFTRKWDVFYKHPLLKPIVPHPRNSEIRYKHIRSSQSSTWRENLNPKHLYFNFLCFCPKTVVWYET